MKINFQGTAECSKPYCCAPRSETNKLCEYHRKIKAIQDGEYYSKSRDSNVDGECYKVYCHQSQARTGLCFYHWALSIRDSRRSYQRNRESNKKVSTERKHRWAAEGRCYRCSSPLIEGETKYCLGCSGDMGGK